MAEPDRRFWTGRAVAVIGGSGFLGSHLLRQLSAVRADVRALGLPPAPHIKGVRFEAGDARDVETVRRVVAGCSIVFNAAGPVAACGPGLLEVHQALTQAALSAADRHARIIHTSSALTIGPSAAGPPLAEDAPTPPTTLRFDYIEAKRAAEAMVLAAAAAGRDALVVNPGYLLGPDDPGSIMGRFCIRFWKGRVFLAPPGGLNLVDVRDVAAGHLLAAEHGEAGQRYILGGENLTVAEFLRRLATVARFQPRLLPTLPGWVLAGGAILNEGRARRRGRPAFPSRAEIRLNSRCWFYRSDRALAELGFAARPLAETLRDTWAWHMATSNPRPRGVNRWLMRPAA